MTLTKAEALHISRFLEPLLGDDPNATLAVLFPGAVLPRVEGGAGVAPVIAWLNGLDDPQLDQVLQLAEGNRYADAARARREQAADDAATGARLEQAQAPAGDPFAAEILDTGAPFLNRAGLRDYLRQLAEPGPIRILVIRGERCSGKTFATEVMAHASRNPGPAGVFSPHCCDLADGPGSVHAVVSYLATGIDLNAAGNVPKDEDSTEQWVRKQLALWLLELARQTAGCHWLVIDSVRRSGSLDWKEPFINELAIQTAKEVSDPDGPRLVLIDHEKPLPFECQPYAAEIELRRIDVEDVREFIQGRVAAQDIEGVVERVRRFPMGEDRLALIQQLVASVALGGDG